MEDLIKVVAEKYGGKYTREPGKVVHTPEGSPRFQNSQALFELNNYKVLVICNEDGFTSYPYKIIAYLQKKPKKHLVLYPRSSIGKLIRKIGYKPIRNKYWTNFNAILFEGISKDFKLESLLISHNVSILSKLDNDQNKLIISPVESVLNLKTMEELIDIVVRLAKVTDYYT